MQALLLQTVLEAADKAITALRLARSGGSSVSRKRKVKDEVSFLFNKKKSKVNNNIIRGSALLAHAPSQRQSE